MQVCIHTHGIDMTDGLKRQAFQKLDLALDRLENDIVSIHIYLRDTNGPLLGGIDKACRIVVRLQKEDLLVVEDIDANVQEVIDRATDRLGVVACQRADALGRRRPVRWLVDDVTSN